MGEAGPKTEVTVAPIKSALATIKSALARPEAHSSTPRCPLAVALFSGFPRCVASTASTELSTLNPQSRNPLALAVFQGFLGCVVRGCVWMGGHARGVGGECAVCVWMGGLDAPPGGVCDLPPPPPNHPFPPSSACCTSFSSCSASSSPPSPPPPPLPPTGRHGSQFWR